MILDRNWAEDGLKIRCENGSLFSRIPLGKIGVDNNFMVFQSQSRIGELWEFAFYHFHQKTLLMKP